MTRRAKHHFIEEPNWRMKCPKCGKIDSVWGIEYSYDHPQRYDGISEWWCNPEAGGCGLRAGRWSGKKITGKNFEYRYGIKKW